MPWCRCNCRDRHPAGRGARRPHWAYCGHDASKHLAVDAQGRVLVTENSTSSTFQSYAALYRTPRDGAPDLLGGTAPQPGHADGHGSAARFDSPGALAVDKAARYVRDRNNDVLRTIASDGTVATLSAQTCRRGWWMALPLRHS